MGKGYHNYMSKKFFHPGNFDNIKRVWMAQQKDAHDKKAEEDTMAQYQKEQELYQNRALLGDEKAKLGLNFMYDPPPGVKRDREKEEDEPEYKFEWQRKYNAPRESYAKGDDAVRDQPFGIEVRNVRCLKCRKWGHINTDKICPMFGKSITADLPQTAGNHPGELMEQMREDGLAFTKKVLSRQNDPQAANQQMVDSDAEADEEVAFFLTLNRKEKKKLIKKLEKERKRNKKEQKRERKLRMRAMKEKETRSAMEAERRKNGQTNMSSDEDHPGKAYIKRRAIRDDSEEPKIKSSRSDGSMRQREQRPGHRDRGGDREENTSHRHSGGYSERSSGGYSERRDGGRSERHNGGQSDRHSERRFERTDREERKHKEVVRDEKRRRSRSADRRTERERKRS